MRIKRIQNDLVLQKINTVLGLRCLHGPLITRILLKKIEISKIMFLMAIEGGQEVFIPKELSQDQLPMSYHYYDPLLNII